jgi:hypothetical protein
MINCLFLLGKYYDKIKIDIVLVFMLNELIFKIIIFIIQLILYNIIVI